jgi:hypothetical protein
MELQVRVFNAPRAYFNGMVSIEAAQGIIGRSKLL